MHPSPAHTVLQSSRGSMESVSVFDERSSSINPHYEKKLIHEKASPLLVGVAGAIADVRKSHDGIVAGIGDKERALVMVEVHAIGAKRRKTARAQKRVGLPGDRVAACRLGAPDDAAERIRNIDVALRIEGQGIEAAALDLREHRRGAGHGIDAEHVARAEVEDPKLPAVVGKPAGRGKGEAHLRTARSRAL